MTPYPLEENVIVPGKGLFEFVSSHFPYIIPMTRTTQNEVIREMRELFGAPLDFESTSDLFQFAVHNTSARWAYLNKAYAKPFGAFFFDDGHDAVLAKLKI